MAARRRHLDAFAVALVTTAILVDTVGGPTSAGLALHLGVLVFNALSALVAAASAPRHERLVLGLIASGVALAVLGDVLCRFLDAGGATTDVSVADPAWLSSYLVLCAAMVVVLVRSGTRGHWHLAVDGLTVTAVSVLVVWSLAIEHIVGGGTAPEHVRLVWASYPFLQAILLALVLMAVTGVGSRRLLDPGFAAGVVLWLATDVAYLHAPSAAGQEVSSATWMVAVVLMARTVWLWSPTAADEVEAPGRWPWLTPLVIAVAPLLVPSAVELVSQLLDDQHHPWRLAIGSAVLITLAFLRTARLMQDEQRVLRELARARDAALDASRAKSMFVATMSHELRTPLTTMLACAEMLQETGLTEHQSGLVARMRRSGGLLQSLVEDVLDFSRLESGRVELAAVPFDLHALAAELGEAYLVRATTAGLGFELEIAADVPRAVCGDPSRMMQVVANLLDNAVRFTDRGNVRLAVRVGRGGSAQHPDRASGSPLGAVAPDVVVEVVVADTGIGIGPDRRESVFGAFEDIDDPARRPGGSGLGLAISRHLVALMGGCLTMRSEVDSGSEFVATFPLVVDVPVGAAAPEVGLPEVHLAPERAGTR